MWTDFSRRDHQQPVLNPQGSSILSQFSEAISGLGLFEKLNDMLARQSSPKRCYADRENPRGMVREGGGPGYPPPPPMKPCIESGVRQGHVTSSESCLECNYSANLTFRRVDSHHSTIVTMALKRYSELVVLEKQSSSLSFCNPQGATTST